VLIEINLAPGAAGARARRKTLPGVRLPSLPAVTGDARTAAAVGAGILVLAVAVFGYWRMGSQRTTLEAQVQQEVTDSIRFASTIDLVRSLQARQDTVRQKIDIIRSVDTRRYVWPHLLDEISLAVPAYVWLAEIGSTEGTDSLAIGPALTIQGNAGSTQSLTRFMKNLESSPFVREVTLITSEQDVMEGRTVQRFSLEALYRVPDAEVIETVPIVEID
jgi:Tfp pilus assembly protein PilN